jgi:hypothetical protein
MKLGVGVGYVSQALLKKILKNKLPNDDYAQADSWSLWKKREITAYPLFLFINNPHFSNLSRTMKHRN